MPLDAAHARLEFADEHAVTEHGGVIFDHRPAQPDNLLAQISADGDKIRGDVGAKRLDLGSQVQYRGVNLGVDLLVHARDIGANVAQEFENEAFRRRAQ